MVRGAFRDIDNRYRSDDGFLLDVIAHNTWRGILNAADAFLLQPHFKLREASGTGMAGGGPANFLDGDYIQFGGRAAYFYLIAEDIRIGAEFAAHYREYEQSIRLGTAERHDWFIAPAAETLFRTSDLSLPADKKKREMAIFAGNTALCKITEDLVFTDPYYEHPMNRWTSAGMSSRRSRRGGRGTVTTARR